MSYDVFFTSDLHFGHTNCATWRGFSSPERMNEVLIDNWNSVVRQGDFVWLLGDAVMGKFVDNVHLLGELNGTIRLVPGNHDRIHPGYGEKREHKLAEFRELYERYVSICPLEVHVSSGDFGLTLCHFPFQGDHTDEDRFVEHRPTDDGQLLVHGHVHDLWTVRGRQINVGVDVHDFTPISFDRLREIARPIV